MTGHPGRRSPYPVALLLSPVGYILGYGFCMRCRVSWWLGTPHDTQYTHSGRACFPLCEHC